MANTTNFGWETPDDTDLVKDGAAAMRTLGNAIDTSFVDLKGGTTNQVLAKNSNTDLDFKWVADASGIPATIFDAKGDLIVATAADTADRLASSAVNGNVLTVDTSTATGLKWAAPTASTYAFALLNTPSGTSMTGAASITINVSSKDFYYINFLDVSSSSASSAFTLRINGDTNSNYIYRGLTVTNGSTAGNIKTRATSYPIGTLGNTAAGDVKASIYVQGGNGTGYKPIQSFSGGDGSSTDVAYSIGGAYDGSAALTSFTFISSAGNFDGGTVFIYGA